MGKKLIRGRIPVSAGAFGDAPAWERREKKELEKD